MLQSIKDLYGHSLSALDGPIGHVKDFYFDDQNWAVRYLIADTGDWLSGRLVLLSPHSLVAIDQDKKHVSVNLTKEQIENSPSIDTHKPVSRQYEEEYYRYYGWPYYWHGDGLWGMSGFPVLEVPVSDLPGELPFAMVPPVRPADSHLRSMRAVDGYDIQANDGTLGHVSDFIMEPKYWAVRFLRIKTGIWPLGKEVQIPINVVSKICYENSKVTVNMTMEGIEQSSDSDPKVA
ncbi:MAG: PRC-barrel domain-containing protein [Verrucomicrobiota bacterium]|nr:PRC-barrel domain-containing protein [Verrucomicrobiota bacterium]